MTTTASTNGKTTTATVETLTAEVRVLMVGSRQITLSVARQLDAVDRADMTPMGRVRLDSHYRQTAPTLIGVSTATGALVLSDAVPSPSGPIFIGTAAMGDPSKNGNPALVVCNRDEGALPPGWSDWSSDGIVWNVYVQGEPVGFDRALVAHCGKDHYSTRQRYCYGGPESNKCGQGAPGVHASHSWSAPNPDYCGEPLCAERIAASPRVLTFVDLFVERESARRQATAARHAADLALPLIVLAGLR